MNRPQNYLAILLLSAASFGCGKAHAPLVGAVNQFDSDTYLTLVTIDNTIQTTRADLQAGNFPINITANVKTALNALINAYNIANSSYQIYHNEALAGTATQNEQVEVQAKVQSASNSLAILTTTKAGK